VFVVTGIRTLEQQSRKKKDDDRRQRRAESQTGSRTGKPRLAAVSARFGYACRRLRRFIVLGNFGHISDTGHISDISCGKLNKVELYDGLFSDIICPLPKLPGDRVQRLQVCSGSKLSEDAPQTEPWITDYEN
jgi:hypothetical protein